MNKPPELFAYERPTTSDFSRRRGIPYAVRRVITLIVMAGLVSGGAYLVWHHAGSTPGEIPTIKAEGSYKQRPEQPGGIDIPHQDVQVYHEIDGSAAALNDKPGVDHMLPPPEEPNQAPMPAASTVVQSPNVSTHPTIEDLTSIVAANNPAPVIATTVDNSPAQQLSQPLIASMVAPTSNPIVAETPSPVVESVTSATPTPTVVAAAPAPAVKGGVVVQLAATTNKAAADSTARNLQTKYGGDLGGAKLHIVRADLGAKGIFYRVQTQPLSDKQARAICDALKNRNAGCLLVR